MYIYTPTALLYRVYRYMNQERERKTSFFIIGKCLQDNLLERIFLYSSVTYATARFWSCYHFLPTFLAQCAFHRCASLFVSFSLVHLHFSEWRKCRKRENRYENRRNSVCTRMGNMVKLYFYVECVCSMHVHKKVHAPLPSNRICLSPCCRSWLKRQNVEQEEQ